MINKYVFSNYNMTAAEAVILSAFYTSQVAFIHFIPCKKKRRKEKYLKYLCYESIYA